MVTEKTVEVVLEKFGEAGLPVKVECVNPQSPDVFQLDIQRGVVKHIRMEIFRIWFGKATVVQVMGISPKLKQLVLYVKEPVRQFTREIVVMDGDVEVAVKDMVDSSAVLKEKHPSYGDRTRLVFEQKTSHLGRRYLLGLDERQFFICEIRKGNSVEEARWYLKPDEIVMAEGLSKVKRQGEWFFKALSGEESNELATYIRKHPEDLRRNVPVATVRGGTPHVAEEVVLIHRWERGDITNGNQRVRPRAVDIFVRGRVRNPRHETVRFNEWRKVIRNTEISNQAGIWVD